MKALKSLGQNFLIDDNIAKDIVNLGNLQPEDKVWEIGPGRGILTEKILSYNVQLRAFELDGRLCNYLVERYGNKLILEHSDILKANWNDLIQQDGKSIKLIANIPYQITSPLLALLEKYATSFAQIILMVQKEVADRLCAEPGNKNYAPLTIRLRLNFNIRQKIQVCRYKFDPIPKVDSTVILMEPRLVKPIIQYPATFNRILNAAFAHRRKTLANNLIAAIGKEKTEALAKLSNIDFRKRGEELDEKDYILLSELISSL